MIRRCILALALAGGSQAQDWGVFPLTSLSHPYLADNFQSRARDSGHEDRDYQRGLSALDAHRWDKAITSFATVAERKGSDADAALYWKAYAQARAGNREDALSTLGELNQLYPSSRWLSDARALDVEVRAQSGSPVNPGSQSDDELKLVAINSLMQSDPNAAFPALQRVLQSGSSVKVKERALFVLTQNSTPQARKLLGEVARNSSNPDLQMRAIQYVGLMGNDEARKELESLYKSSTDERVKRAILHSFMRSGSREFLLSTAKTEKDPELRRQAIQQLAVSGGQNEIWQLYQSSNSPEEKKAILRSMLLGGSTSRVSEIARNEKDPALRITAIKQLGIMERNGTSSDVLVSIYRSDQNPEVRLAVLDALFLQQNGKVMVDLARAEKDPSLKEQIVKKMSLIHSKEVTDYMMEVLK